MLCTHGCSWRSVGSAGCDAEQGTAGSHTARVARAAVSCRSTARRMTKWSIAIWRRCRCSLALSDRWVCTEKRSEILGTS
eukprot:1619444-Pleurochrysis_carterae.AAC.5